MPKRFDPYHAWLGIPAEEQPPNHYRLLGISLFESNDDVIQNGLDQRMAHVKSFANGPHAAESQRLLTDLSQAGVCLLRPEKKQAYDQQLRSRLLATAAAAPVQLGPAPPPASPDGAVPIGPPPPVGLSASPGTAGSPPVPPEAAQAQSPPSSRTGFPMIPTLVGAAIGLGVACLALFLLSPGEKIPPAVAQTNPVKPSPPGVGRTPQENGQALEATSATAAVQVDRMPAGSLPQTAPVAGLPNTDPLATGSVPAISPSGPMAKLPEPQPSWPTPLPGSPLTTPTNPPSQATDPFSAAGNPTTPAGTTPGGATPGTAPNEQRSETARSVVLDLERSSMHVILAEKAEGMEVRAQVRTFTNLTTPYDMQPADGLVRVGKPVEILLTQYAGVKIRLSLRMRGGNADLEIAPEIETGQGKTSDFSKATLDSLSISTRKHALAVNQQLAGAQAEAVEIQRWLAAPIPKTVPVRKARVQRLNVLTTQAVPSLQKQLADAQMRMDLIQQLSVLVGQLHEKARLELVVQVEPADKAE